MSIYELYQLTKDELSMELNPANLLTQCGCPSIDTTSFLGFVESVSHTPIERLSCLLHEIAPHESAATIRSQAQIHHANLR